MGYSNAYISSPVSIKDLQQGIGTSLTDLGTIVTDAPVNMWAKYKPIRHSNMDYVTMQDRKNAFFGLSFPKISGWQNPYFGNLAFGIISGSGEKWDYLKPRGANFNEPYRLTDYVRKPNDATDSSPAYLTGYHTSAVMPFTTDLVGKENYTKTSGGSYVVNINESPNVTFYAETLNGGADISLWDFVSLLSTDTNYPYRMVVEVYRSENGWWNATPVVRRVSPAITAANASHPSDGGVRVTIASGECPTSSLIVVGLQRTNNDDTYRELTDPSFFAPWVGNNYSFYFPVVFDTSAKVRFDIIGLGWGGIYTFNQSGNSFSTSYNYSGNAFISLQLSRSAFHYYYTSEHVVPQNVESGYNLLQIAMRDDQTGTYYYFKPADENRQRYGNGWLKIYMNSNTGTYNIYGIAENAFPSSHTAGEIKGYTLFMRTAAPSSSPVYTNWSIINTFSIYYY